MTPIEMSIQAVRPDRIPNPEAQNPELVRCFRHEGVGCPRCDGSGFTASIKTVEPASGIRSARKRLSHLGA